MYVNMHKFKVECLDNRELLLNSVLILEIIEILLF